jgi:hypothetical protein
MTRWPKKGQAGAGSRIRTDDLLITNQLLYQLSYAGKRTARSLAYKIAANKLSILRTVDRAVPARCYIRERGRA